MQTDATAPLTGVRVLDASRVLAGPFCGQMLGDLGAEVVKIERPGAGDETRGWGPPFAGDLSAYFLSCNRNKNAVTLDLGQPDGLQLFYDLAQMSAVLVETFRLLTGDMPARQGNAHLQMVAYQAFQTADDWLILAIGNDGQWQRFCAAAERPDLARDPRFTTNTQRVTERAVLVPLIEAVMQTRP